MNFRRSNSEREREDWYRWRGAMTAGFDALGAELRQTLERNEMNFNRRMDKHEENIEKVLEQAKLTNGRVTALEQDRAVQVELRADGLRHTEEGRTATRHRVSAAVALASGAVGTAVGVAAQHIFK